MWYQLFVAHDGSEGLSPDGWLPDRISIGVLTRVFTPELVDAAVDAAGAREQRRRLLPARLVVYFVLALWLFRGRNCGYGQVMLKLAEREGPLSESPELRDVVASGRSLLVTSIPADRVEGQARDPEHLEQLRLLNVRSGAIVPLRVRGRSLGVMALTLGNSGRRFSSADLAFLEECRQIDFVEAVKLMRRISMVQPPQPSIGQDAPIQATVLHIKGNLIGGILVREGITTDLLERHIQWAIPMFRVTHGKGSTLQEGLVEFFAFIHDERMAVSIEDVVRGLGAIGGFERCLHLKEMPQAFQDELDNALFCLCLLLTGSIVSDDALQIMHHRFSLGSQPLPVFTPWQNDVEVVVGEELLIAVWVLRERKLNSLSSWLCASTATH